jgi:DNA-binding transcriptional LysR family regulator
LIHKLWIVVMRKLTFDLDVLRSFVLGIELGSFAQAADRLGRSTSAISAQLKRLEDQIDQPIVQKSGRGIALTPRGELLMSYAKRMLELNDEAATAVCGVDLEGTVRIGLQEDFGEGLLTAALGRFANAHPQVRIEARIARNAELLRLINDDQLDLALAWDSGGSAHTGRLVGELPICWIGRPGHCLDFQAGGLPLVVFEAPCLMRSAAIHALDKAGISWRIAFTSASLSGIWAAVDAGLGITIRTPVGLPKSLRILSNMPALPNIRLLMHGGNTRHSPLVGHFEEIILETLIDLLPRES